MPFGPAQDGKNGAHIDVDVDIGRTIQGIEYQNIVPARKLRAHADQLRFFLGTHGAERAAALHAVEHNAVGDGVHFLHVFALHVHFARAAQNIQQPGLINAARNALAGKDQVVKQARKLARGLRAALLVQQQMLGNRNIGHKGLLFLTAVEDTGRE